MSHESNGWDQHKLLVLDALDRLEEKLSGLDSKQDEMMLKLVELRTEKKVASYWGNIVLPGLVAVGVSWVGRKLGF